MSVSIYYPYSLSGSFDEDQVLIGLRGVSRCF